MEATARGQFVHQRIDIKPIRARELYRIPQGFRVEVLPKLSALFLRPLALNRLASLGIYRLRPFRLLRLGQPLRLRRKLALPALQVSGIGRCYDRSSDECC